MTLDIQNPFYRFEDIFQTIFLAKFHENPTLQRGVDSIFASAGSLPLKLNQLSHIVMKLCKENLLVNIKSIEVISDMCCKSKDMADFLDLQGKLEHPNLIIRFQGGCANKCEPCIIFIQNDVWFYFAP